MRIFVKAKPNSKEAHVKRIDGTHFVVAVREQPEKGRANQAVMKALQKHLHKPVKLVSGSTSRQKVFTVTE